MSSSFNNTSKNIVRFKKTGSEGEIEFINTDCFQTDDWDNWEIVIVNNFELPNPVHLLAAGFCEVSREEEISFITQNQESNLPEK